MKTQKYSTHVETERGLRSSLIFSNLTEHKRLNRSVQDTCFTTVNVTAAPATYNVNCFADGTPDKLDASAPRSYYTATVICDAINSGKVPPNTWYWEMPQAGFALGVWLPGNPGDAPCPHWDQCVLSIYYHMIQGCGSSAGHNGGAVNVAKLPDMSQSGLAVDAGYPSYIMVPKPLTRVPK